MAEKTRPMDLEGRIAGRLNRNVASKERLKEER